MNILWWLSSVSKVNARVVSECSYIFFGEIPKNVLQTERIDLTQLRACF